MTLDVGQIIKRSYDETNQGLGVFLTLGSTHYSPAEVGIDDVDLKASPGTSYTSVMFNFAPNHSICIFCKWTVTGSPTAGNHYLLWEAYDDDDVLVQSASLVTSTSNQSSGTAYIFYPRGVSAGQTGWAGAGAAIELLRCATKGKIKLFIAASNNGTTATADIHVFVTG